MQISRTVCALMALTLATTSCSRLRDQLDPPSARPATPPDVGPPTVATGTTTPPESRALGLVAFPGAEGFGAGAKGGRGGAVCHVTTVAHAGPGSMQSCLDARGPRTIVFDISGTIEGPVEIKHGQVTIAGQTSPGVVVVKGGMVCDNVYDPNDCNDVIVRHMRFRGGEPDSLRIGGAHDVIIDHCSMASAEDENVEITRSRNVTIQHSIVAEPRGEHYQWGGVLINYSKDVLPLDAITIHHTVWNGVAGRLPEMSCEENDDGPGKSNCNGHVLSIELSNNVLWDASDPIWFNHCTGNNAGNDCAPTAPSFSLRLNLVGNVMVRRGTADQDSPLVERVVYTHRGGSIFAADNLLGRGAMPPAAAPPLGPVAAARHAFPPVTYTKASALVALLARTAGAWPRDRMDERLSSYLARSIDARPPSWTAGQGVNVGDGFVTASGAPAPVDSDGDGMPDAWEKANGLDPARADGATVAQVNGCPRGYTALECYLNARADARVPR